MALYHCKKCNRNNLLADEITWNCIWPGICKLCKRKESEKYRREGGIKYSRNKTFKNKYGITLEQYEKLLEKQNNPCVICLRTFSNMIKPNIDHCHKLKIVRGILCHSCNLALGYLKENEEIILNLLEYIRKNQSPIQGEGNVNTIQ